MVCREAAIEAAQANEVVAGDGFLQCSALIVGDLSFGIRGQALLSQVGRSPKQLKVSSLTSRWVNSWIIPEM